MNKLYRALENKTTNNISGLSKVKKISKKNEIEADKDKIALALEPITEEKYNQRKGKWELPIFIYCYASEVQLNNADSLCEAVRKKVIGLLDESDLSNTEIKTYQVEYDNSSPVPKLDQDLNMWYSLAKFIIRWSEK